MIRLLNDHRELSILLLTLLLFGGLALLQPEFAGLDSVSLIFKNALILMVVAAGATVVILTRGIDVSLGSILGLSAVSLGLQLQRGLGLEVALPLTLLVGLAAGFLNGMIVTQLQVPPIVTTLGTLGVYRGLTLTLTQGKWIENLPDDVKRLAQPGLLGFPPVVWLATITLVGLALFLRYTAAGRAMYATGDNPAGAELLGIRPRRVQIAAFSLAGLCAAVAGIIFTAQIGFIPSQAGTGIELRAIAASVIGGISLLGGVGTVLGAMLGAFFLTSVDSFLVFLKVPAYWNDMVAGLILLVVLVIDARIRERVMQGLRLQRYQRVHKERAQSSLPVVKEG
ncbi:autoinducer 2 ABC transporter permease LsrC [Deinococcus sp. S9]|uniref:autoinducer 2 ABC transporter permease LsrC n=1 Tax=Deinococcus sp. S9 TaxID=2545754 RepID=UPI0010542486|nr:autoinducer 2 ABC transporter permease LsrC [Deinococcus sp. S9]TDE85032.1 autoinducer 2 ABC transporter permease LsrC [Deinococcus sp. S9]